MAEKTIQPKKVSGSNTKQQLLEAYDDLVKQIEKQREAELRPEEKIKEKEARKAIEIADSLSMDAIIKNMSSIKGEAARLLGELSERMEQEINKYIQIKKAIHEKEDELREIYEIQKSAQSLAALIEAQNQKRGEFETEMTSRTEELERELRSRKEELEQEIETTRENWKKEKEETERLRNEEKEAETNRRKREKEEFDYAFKRERQLAKDKFEDEKAKLEKEIEEKRVQLEIEFAEREKVLKERENELQELRTKAEKFPKELETAVSKAVKESTDRIEHEAKNREKLLTKEFEGERNVLKARIESLEQTISEQNDRLAKLSQQAETASSQVQDIAVKAIEGSSNLKSFEHLQELVKEQTRKPAQEK